MAFSLPHSLPPPPILSLSLKHTQTQHIIVFPQPYLPPLLPLRKPAQGQGPASLDPTSCLTFWSWKSCSVQFNTVEGLSWNTVESMRTCRHGNRMSHLKLKFQRLNFYFHLVRFEAQGFDANFRWGEDIAELVWAFISLRMCFCKHCVKAFHLPDSGSERQLSTFLVCLFKFFFFEETSLLRSSQLFSLYCLFPDSCVSLYCLITSGLKNKKMWSLRQTCANSQPDWEETDQ